MTHPEEYFAHAAKLVEAAADEVQRRAALSRLYYAIFHCVCLQLQLELKGAHVHEQLLDALRRRDANSIRAANRLNSLRQLRILADYNRDESLSQMQLRSAINHAGAVRSLLGITGTERVATMWSRS